MAVKKHGKKVTKKHPLWKYLKKTFPDINIEWLYFCEDTANFSIRWDNEGHPTITVEAVQNAISSFTEEEYAFTHEKVK